jgi:type I restriction enzyme S subunit
LKALNWVRLGGIATKIGSGLTPLGGEPTYHSTGVPFIRSQNIHLNRFEKAGLAFLSDEQDAEMIDSRVLPGDVLLNITGASIGRVCIVPAELCPANVNQHVCIIRTNGTIDPRFLAYFLATTEFQQFIVNSQSGATRQALTKGQIEEFHVPLPDAMIQQRTVAILERADRLRRLRRYGVEMGEEVLPAAFQRLFGDPSANRARWHVATLGELTTLVTSGLTPTGGEAVYVRDGPLFIRSQNVLMNHLDLTEAACLPPSIHESMRRTKVTLGDVLLNITGASIGRVAWVPALQREANVNQHVCIVRLDRSRATPEFISFLISSRFGQAQIDQMQAGASRQGLNHDQVRSLALPLPPLPLQERFSALVQACERQQRIQRESLRQVEHLFQTLLHRAFTDGL